MPDFTGSKIQNPRCRQRQRGFKTKKGTNTTANPSYVLKKMFLPHLLYIVYQIFRWAQIFVGFFRSRERSGAAGGFSGSFAKKISRAKHAQLEDTSLKKVPSFTNKIYHKICQIARIKLHIQYTIFSTKYNSKDAKPAGNASSAALLFCRQKRGAAFAAPQASEQKLRFTGAVSKCLQHTRIHISGISPEIVFQNSVNLT